MMKPFPGTKMSVSERVFNYRLSRARRIIEKSFGILSTKWRIFRTAIIADLDTVESIIMSFACLHNWLRQQKCRNYLNPGLVDIEKDGNYVSGSWRAEDKIFQNLEPRNVNYSTDAKDLRNRFEKYFKNKGAATGQDLQFI